MEDVLAPIEWVVRSMTGAYPAGVIRLLHLGPEREAYYRAVSYAAASKDRKLIGYFATLEDSVTAVHAYEYGTIEPQRLATGPATWRERPEMPEWKRPPGVLGER